MYMFFIYNSVILRDGAGPRAERGAGEISGTESTAPTTRARCITSRLPNVPRWRIWRLSRKAIASLDPPVGGVNRWTTPRPGDQAQAVRFHPMRIDQRFPDITA